MSNIDWTVLIFTLVIVVVYGVFIGRGQKSNESYLKADNKMPWYIVLIGIMATQASAITFLSAPGQAYTDGMRFVQYYFGLPLAMIVICITFIPIFQRLNVYTAYEYLENRFDKKTRVLTSLLFLFSRGLSTGISIYAPSIILSSVLNWNIYVTNILTGGILLIYTYVGGAKAIAHTQKLQFLIILGTMAFAGFLLIQNMPDGIGFTDALYLAGKSGKLNVITTEFDWKDKYNIWSGLIGGFFLALSYFGTDQSQVGRYITAKDNTNAKMGLLLNGLVKIPMQFAILLIGALLFAFFSLKPAPIYFNERSYQQLKEAKPEQAAVFEKEHQNLQLKFNAESKEILKLKETHSPQLKKTIQDFKDTQTQVKALHSRVEEAINNSNYNAEKTDTNYIFLYFVKNTLPVGMIGLLFAVIFLASWGSISAALNSLAACSLKDVHLIFSKEIPDEKTELKYSRLHTLAWGIFSIAVAMFATQMGSLIEAVNVLGSLFYGPILGIFLVAFYYRKITGPNVFIAAILSEIAVIAVYQFDIVSFLWLNVIGAAAVIVFSAIGLLFYKEKTVNS
ncbi:SSS family transporter [Chryseobacterium bernardetii]|uniref:SSS family transporter n=2 Tax=Chryseobacterium TaxID=59732 RepID=A0A543EL80_9FLAO|nr:MULTISPECIES: sodium:solute symporter [Chryseobacterium]MDR6372378.1 SSS family transporter [Chryseobacterium vietnamense]MDR6442238.1 SSS family transporter [Chryseobacterium bernardetii]TQM22335.1 SSS family transporter [Chryseobacterium aquifrigidense]